MPDNLCKIQGSLPMPFPEPNSAFSFFPYESRTPDLTALTPFNSVCRSKIEQPSCKPVSNNGSQTPEALGRASQAAAAATATTQHRETPHWSETPKGSSSLICRETLGPVNFLFHRKQKQKPESSVKNIGGPNSLSKTMTPSSPNRLSYFMCTIISAKF